MDKNKMKIDIKLRRKFEGQDGYGTYIEEIGVDEEGLLRYRATTGGNDIIGEYLEWESEENAIKFLLGFIPKSDKTIKLLRKEFKEQPTLLSYEDDPEINFQTYMQ